MFDSPRMRAVCVVVVLLLTAAACSSSKNTASPATTTSTNSANAPGTSAPGQTVVTDAPAATQCRVSEVPAVVRASAVAGLDQPPIQYNVINVRIAASDPEWGRFDAVPKPGVKDYQGGFGIVQCIGTHWKVTDFGTDNVGCPRATQVAPPALTRTQLGLHCA